MAREVDEMYDEKGMMANPVGTGPYRLVDWRRSSRIVLEKNPTYRDDIYNEQPNDEYGVQAAARMKGRKLPLIDRVEIYIVEENQPRWLAFLNGEHDLVDEIPYDLANLIVPNGKLAPNLVKRGIQMDRDYRASVDMALFNMEHPLVGGYTADKVALRRAIGLAYEMPNEIRLVRKNQSIPSQSPVSPLTSGYDPAFKSEMGEYNPARAKALLDSFGYVDRDGDGWRDMPDGKPLLLEMATQPDPFTRALDEIWRKSMTAVNINMTFKPAKWPENLKNSRAGKLMMWRVGWVAAQPDGDVFLHSATARTLDRPIMLASTFRHITSCIRCRERCLTGPSATRCLLEAKKLFVAYMPYKFVGHRIETAMFHPWVSAIAAIRSCARCGSTSISTTTERRARRMSSFSRRDTLKALGAFPIAASTSAQTTAQNGKKVLRYAFEVAETGFDPVSLSDLYSRIVTSHIFDRLYRYDYLARPYEIPTLRPLRACLRFLRTFALGSFG